MDLNIVPLWNIGGPVTMDLNIVPLWNIGGPVTMDQHIVPIWNIVAPVTMAPVTINGALYDKIIFKIILDLWVILYDSGVRFRDFNERDDRLSQILLVLVDRENKS